MSWDNHKEKIERIKYSRTGSHNLSTIQGILTHIRRTGMSELSIPRNSPSEGPSWVHKDGSYKFTAKLNGKEVLHREDGPAIKTVRKKTNNEPMVYTLEWYQYGELHREDGPAKVSSTGLQIWVIEGQWHRDNDLPALMDSSGTREWFWYGKRHRENGPAVISEKGKVKQWYWQGKRHREDGPASIRKNTGVTYWQRGQRHRADGPAVITRMNNKTCIKWYLNGQLHREGDKPASYKSFANDKNRHTQEWEWYAQDKAHRENGPAHVKVVSYKNRDSKRVTKTWLRKDRLHREGKPAIICYEPGKIFEAKYCHKGNLHREEGPAVITAKFHTFEVQRIREWYVHGVRHKQKGPAKIVEFTDLPSGERAHILYEWFSKGFRYRHGDKPSKIEWSKVSEDKEIFRAAFTDEFGYLYRPEGPALINPEERRWHKKPEIGYYHNETGPALIEKENGELRFIYGLEGEDMPYEEWLKQTGQDQTTITAKRRI